MSQINLLNRYRKKEISVKEKQEKKKLKKRRNVIRAAYEPLFPAFIRMLYLAMFLFPALDILAEMILCIQRKTTVVDFFGRCSWSAFVIWIVFGGIVILLCIFQILRAQIFGYEEKQYLFAEEIPEKERDKYALVNGQAGEENRELWLYEGTSISIRKKYGRYIIITLAEGGALGIFYLVVLL